MRRFIIFVTVSAVVLAVTEYIDGKPCISRDIDYFIGTIVGGFYTLTHPELIIKHYEINEEETK